MRYALNASWKRRKTTLSTESGLDALVIDVSHLAHRQAHALTRFKTADGRPSGHIYGCFKAVKALYFTYKPRNLVFCYDRGYEWRKALVPSYKQSRRVDAEAEGPSASDLPENWDHVDFQLSQRFATRWTPAPDVERLLRCIPGIHMAAEDGEADDMVAKYVLENDHHGSVAVFSGDRDLFQLIDDENRISVMTVKKTKPGTRNANVTIQEEDVYAHFECGPKLVSRVKALLGDDSDSIQGLTGAVRPGKRAALREFATKNLDYFTGGPYSTEGLHPELALALDQQRDRMMANFSVTDLPTAVSRYKVPMERSAPELAHMLGVLIEFECESLLAQCEPWISLM